MFRHSLLLAAFLGITTVAHAQTKMDALFDELQRDFGSVPRGPDLTHPFRIVNTTKQTVRISGVRVSCGVCSTAHALKQSLQPGEETAIVATMFTSRFLNSKVITIYVTFDQPRFQEVRLWMQAN